MLIYVLVVRILVLSDIHGNLDALKAVLDNAGDYDTVICAGDITGYGAYPSECIRQARITGFLAVRGNHDDAIGGIDSLEDDWYNGEARRAIDIHKSLLSEEEKRWLRNLPINNSLEFDNRRIAIFHGSPTQPLTSYVHPHDMENYAHLYLGHTASDVVILGHTHIPYVVRRSDGIVFNPGSVGQPRDRDPRASFAILKLPELEVNIKRVEYNVDAASRAIKDRGLPHSFAQRLYLGI